PTSQVDPTGLESLMLTEAQCEERNGEFAYPGKDPKNEYCEYRSEQQDCEQSNAIYLKNLGFCAAPLIVGEEPHAKDVPSKVPGCTITGFDESPFDPTTALTIYNCDPLVPRPASAVVPQPYVTRIGNSWVTNSPELFGELLKSKIVQPFD